MVKDTFRHHYLKRQYLCKEGKMLFIRALNQIKEDIKTIYDKDPAADNLLEV